MGVSPPPARALAWTAALALAAAFGPGAGAKPAHAMGRSRSAGVWAATQGRACRDWFAARLRRRAEERPGAEDPAPEAEPDPLQTPELFEAWVRARILAARGSAPRARVSMVVPVMREARSRISARADLDGEAKALLWRRFAWEADLLSGGYWRAYELRGEGGERVFLGTLGHALVFARDGGVLHGDFDEGRCGRIGLYLRRQSRVQPGVDRDPPQLREVRMECIRARSLTPSARSAPSGSAA